MLCDVRHLLICLFRKISATADEAGKAGGGGGGGAKSGPGKAAMPGPSNLAAFRATLWTHLDQVGPGRLDCKRPILWLASSKILTPPPLTAGECVLPPPLVRGEDTLAGWRGGWGSIFWKMPGTALYSTYLSTLWPWVRGTGAAYSLRYGFEYGTASTCKSPAEVEFLPS
jgi:hypothetical protein